MKFSYFINKSFIIFFSIRLEIEKKRKYLILLEQKKKKMKHLIIDYVIISIMKRNEEEEIYTQLKRYYKLKIGPLIVF